MKNVILELTRIIQDVAMVESPSDQVRLIVDSISRVIGVDVCSLYRLAENGDMVLLASHGLAPVENVVLPAGRGLVGLVARSRHSINVADASSQPDYYFVADIHEEEFKSFCGVPLVRFGDVVGVLVVQSVQAKQLSDENEAFLVTLASQLALIVSEIPVTKIKPSAINLQLKGIKGAPGIGIGTVQLCDTGELFDVADAPCEDPVAEIEQWHKLLEMVQNDVKAEQASLSGIISENIAGIFDAYQMLLADHSLIEKVEAEIRAGHWLPGALRLTVHYFAELFRAMDDPYLKARHEDIQHLGNKIFNVWRGINHRAKVAEPTEDPMILVGAQVSISEIASVAEGQLVGIVCFEGAKLSHTAILANAMGIPAVMAVGAIKGLKSGQQLIVDGNEGQIVLQPNDSVLEEFRQLIGREQFLAHRLESLRDLPAITKDSVRVRMLTNTGLLADISPGIRNGAEGIGLYRTEIPFMVRNSFPTEEDQVQVYRKVLAAYQNKPVYMRTLDIGGDKQLPYFPIAAEENPALGWRGIRFTLDNIQLLMTQVRAMIRAAEGGDNLYILLPMISSTVELNLFRQLLDDACDQLRNENVAFTKPKVGIMVEVPAAVSQIPFWQKKIDFVSVGSNDLSQYLLAMDRNNSRVAKRYDHVHPAVLHEIYRIVKVAKRCNLALSLCGEMASDPIAVMLLLGMGVRNLSMSSAKLPRIKWLIRSLTIIDTQNFLDRALVIDDVEEIRTMGKDLLDSLGMSELMG